MKRPRNCPDCGGTEIFTTRISSGGGYAPDLLPGAHPRWWGGAKIDVHVCGKCGLLRMYAAEETLPSVRESKKFSRLG